MAGRIIANLIVMGSGVLLRAASQAYKQAIINGTKAGMSAENGAKQAVSKTATMTVEEARQILGVDPNATPDQVMQKFQHLWNVNEQHGSFYILSKVYRAMETIEPEIAENARLDYVAKKTAEHQAKMEGQKPDGDEQETKQQ
uniref:Mitochondrial import inner membrane translocase subunit TIM16 n=1 Tax=Pyramimonas obovata TaxID=1411642 RepID=A0A7S0RYH7_9CHLO|mmetsp:Transcript_8284/g.17088  ORF Transcript_8284/g.17088 Transcript_8284/m.17088 type:complete len:143 (+) Transcript_8284:401-829(+)